MDCYSCKWLFWTSVLSPVLGDEREGYREGELVSEEDKLRASTLDQPHSTSLTMEYKGVCVLLGVLLLVSSSLQQTAPKKKVVKKGRWENNLLESYLNNIFIFS